MLRLIMLLLLSSASAAADTVYKIVKEDGTIVFTDTPQNGAVAVDLEQVNTAVIPTLTPDMPAQVIKRRERALPEVNLTLLQPSNEQTIRNSTGSFNVVAALEPSVPGTFQLYLNNELIAESDKPSFSLTDINRGEHTIEVKFKHRTGKILASSNPTVIYLHRPSRLITPGQ